MRHWGERRTFWPINCSKRRKKSRKFRKKLEDVVIKVGRVEFSRGLECSCSSRVTYTVLMYWYLVFILNLHQTQHTDLLFSSYKSNSLSNSMTLCSKLNKSLCSQCGRKCDNGEQIRNIWSKIEEYNSDNMLMWYIEIYAASRSDR